MYNKQHLISVLGYIGIGFVGGSISHGFFSGRRSVIMAVLGIIIFIISEYLKGGEKNYMELIVGGLIFSVAIGMVSGGLQHFLDSPMRSLWIIPVGWMISTAIYPYKEGLSHIKRGKSLIVGLMISITLFLVCWGLLRVIPADWFMELGHH